MTYESDAVLARAAGLSNEERYALDAIADGDPRLSRPALYDHARDIADVMSSKARAELEERINDLESDLAAAHSEANAARADCDIAEAQSRMDADDASRYKAFLDRLVEDIEAL